MAKDKTIQNKLENFNQQRCVKFLKNRNQTKSMMEILGVHRDENKHSDFLAWLFDSSADHQLGAEPAKKLIKLILTKCQEIALIIKNCQDRKSVV